MGMTSELSFDCERSKDGGGRTAQTEEISCAKSWGCERPWYDWAPGISSL